VQRGRFVRMIRLHPADILTELRLPRSVGIGRLLAVAFFYRGLHLRGACNVGDSGGALHGGGILIGVIHHLDIEPAVRACLLIIRIDLDGTIIVEVGSIKSPI